ncbi:flagellar protein FlaG [Methylobacillus gramineus]|uniref:flagellar protein FlaG n=1 Tax=Methylobacillus gramineus TaxID=755169 RepID=UPI001CFFA295|nr:flagellar protein FlaG [Methylobacillus gramineus]MCB5183755.1 flagellar protein FlaG [Methylobacillus gramineus]
MAIVNLDAYAQTSGLGGLQKSAQPLVPVSGVSGNKQAEQKPAPEASQENVESAVKQINEFISPVMQSIQFSTDNDSGRVVVKVVDSETQKVLRQIPNEEVLQIAKTLGKLQGLVIRQTA